MRPIKTPVLRFVLAAVLAVAVAVTLAPGTLAAQVEGVCTLAGVRVRIGMADESTVTGDFLGCTDQGLQVRPEDGSGGLSPFIDHFIPRSEVLTFHVSHGFRKEVLRPAAIGVSLVGVLFGGFAYLTGDDGGSCATEDFCVRLARKRKTVAAFIVGAALGAGGGLIHGLSQEVEVWRPWPEVPLAHGMTLDAHPMFMIDGAVGARFVLRF